ncbi:MAG TPA: hypothetical protein VFU28_17120 [Vicinamibacterales bacterium]|nr:hypothetical protein [Vicinamibacterales bacterium]
MRARILHRPRWPSGQVWALVTTGLHGSCGVPATGLEQLGAARRRRTTSTESYAV